MPVLLDSHTHLNASAFEHDIGQVLHRARRAGIGHMVVPAVDAQSWHDIRALCAMHERVHPAYGLHPMFIAHHARDHVDELSAWLRTNHAVAVGEIGLDFHHDSGNQDQQRDYFKRQLGIAREHDLPVIVHARGAMEEVILTLRREGGLRGVVHSFSGSEQQARNLWDIGFHIGIGGPVTYERAKRLRRIVAGMPGEFLLLETDAPDQPDAAHWGQRNEPERLTEVLQCVAALRRQSPEAIAASTTANAQKLFNIGASSTAENSPFIAG